MTPKEFLTQGYRIQDKINSLKRQLMNIEQGMSAPNYSAIGGKSENNASQTELRALKSLELRDLILIETNRLEEIQIAIFKAIEGLEDINEQLVLRYRYIDDNTGKYPSWDVIAYKLHFSLRQTLRIHGKALEHLKF